MSLIPSSHRKFFLILIYITLFALFCYYVLPTLLTLFLPFIFGFIIALIVKPVVIFAERRLKIPRNVTSALCVLLVVLLFFFIIFVAVSQVTAEINRIIQNFPQLNDTFKIYVDKFLQSKFGNWLPIESKTALQNFSADLGGGIMSMLQNRTTFDFAKDIITSLPGKLIFTIVMLISAFFISSDSQVFYQGLSKFFSPRYMQRLTALKNSLFLALGGYIKAELTIMSITFCQLFIWFLFLKTDYALTLAFVIALVDGLPFLGTSSVLVPWSIISFIQGDFRLGTMLLLIAGITMAVRQLLEPKLVSIHIGLHPLLTLMSMYVGLQIYGIVGLILGPVLLIVLRNLGRMGVFDSLKPDDAKTPS